MQNHTPTHPDCSFAGAALRLCRLFAFVALSGAAATQAFAQGCVAAHGSGLPKDFADFNLPPEEKWDDSVSYRWFKSDRHYVGTAYQAQRDAAGDQVINRSNFIDVGLNYTATPRYSVAMTIPFVVHDRSQVVKNSSGVILERFHTQAAGLADASISGYAWILNPATATKGNIQVGLGLVLPTGKHDVQDTFETFDKVSGKIVAVQKAVDESIQPGTGGYGIAVSLNGYRVLGAGFTGYADATYTVTPQQRNSVGNSISDTYLGRIGAEYAVSAVNGLSLSLGMRAEGVAVYDLIGGSLGFRRPGYSVAVEPGVIYARRNWSARLYVPYAVQRDRLQSYPDKLKTWSTGKYSQGDAAFADYLIAWSLDHRF